MEIITEFWNDIENAFTALDSEQSVMALVLAGIIYLLGLWTAWLIWGIRARRRMKQIRQLESQYNSLEAEHKVLTAQQEQLTLDFEGLTKEKEAADAQIISLQKERKAFEHQYSLLKDENSAYMGDIDTYIKKIDMMDTQIRNITTHNAQLEEELKLTGNTMNSLAAVQSSFNSTKDRLTVVEARISELVGENQALRTELSGIKTTPTTSTDLGIADISDDEADSTTTIIGNEEDPIDKVNQIGEARLAIQDAVGTKIPMASMNEKDDLQQINGIGSFIEKQLNELGIYTFEQICAWDDALIEQVTTAIEFFPGRIKKDDWKGQACTLKNGTAAKDVKPVTDSSTKTSKKSIKLDDLKIIEGIGPKIEKILKAADIKNLELLSNSKLDTLKTILKKAGGRFRLAVPDTWAKQADMAVKGNLEELKKYQDYLDGGKEPK